LGIKHMYYDYVHLKRDSMALLRQWIMETYQVLLLLLLSLCLWIVTNGTRGIFAVGAD